MHAGLGNLSNFSQKGTLDSMMSDLIQALPSQYRIVEFVESVLGGEFLRGHCPPIEAWLESNRNELMRRKLNPTITERLKSNPVWSRWLLVPITALMLGWGYLTFLAAERTAIGPLAGQLFDLQNPSPLISIYQSRPTRGMRDLIEEIGKRADAGALGSVFFCNPLEQSVKNPTVEIQVIDNGQRLVDPDGIVTDKYDGLVPVGTMVTVVYECKEPRPFPLTFNVWIK